MKDAIPPELTWHGITITWIEPTFPDQFWVTRPCIHGRPYYFRPTSAQIDEMARTPIRVRGQEKEN